MLVSLDASKVANAAFKGINLSIFKRLKVALFTFSRGLANALMIPASRFPFTADMLFCLPDY